MLKWPLALFSRAGTVVLVGYFSWLAWQELGPHSVVFGTVHSLETRGGGASIDVEASLADVDSGRVAPSKRYGGDNEASSLIAANAEAKATSFPWFQRLLGWMIAVLLLPVFTIAFIRAMVRKESNRVNAYVLALYTAVDAMLAYLLAGAAFASWPATALFIMAVAVAFAYNFRIMTFALSLEN